MRWKEMSISRKLFRVSHSNLAVRFSTLSDFFFLRSLIELAFVVYFSLKMSRYSVSERIFIVRTHYSNNSPIVTQRKFTTEFKLKTTGPSMSTINLWKQWNFDPSASDTKFRYSFASYNSYRRKTRRTCI